MKRLWGIRHIRYCYLSYKLSQWVTLWGQLTASPQDIAYLDAVWKGEE